MNRFWSNSNVWVRFASIYLSGLMLLFLFWFLSYYLLPEGIFRGIGLLGNLAGEKAADTFLEEFLRILGLNLLGFLLIIGGNLLLRVRNFSFGFLVPIAWMIMYGLILGTNSFEIPMENRLYPTLTVFSRSGAYEMMAGVLMAAATSTISRNYSPDFTTPSTHIPKKDRPPLSRQQWFAIGISLAILVAAAWREASMIMQV